MPKDDRSHQIREAARTLGLSMGTIKRLAPAEVDLPFTPEYPGEQHTSCHALAGEDLLIAELRDHIASLERRLDNADTELHELLKAAAAERNKLVRLIAKRRPTSAWPGIWPLLQRLRQRFSKKI